MERDPNDLIGFIVGISIIILFVSPFFRTHKKKTKITWKEKN